MIPGKIKHPLSTVSRFLLKLVSTAGSFEEDKNAATKALEKPLRRLRFIWIY